MNDQILVVNEHGQRHDKPFDYLKMKTTYDHKLLNANPCPIGLVIFTGGADISPGMYEAAPHSSTYSSTTRDLLESFVFSRAVNRKIPIIGICRGAQLSCVMSGGRLVQDVTGHQMGWHPVKVNYPHDGHKIVDVKGDHHQMQYPWDLPEEDYVVLAEGVRSLSKHYIFGPEHIVLAADATTNTKREPDIVWYERSRALAIQFHPEWMPKDHLGVKLIQQLTNHFVVPHIIALNEAQECAEKRKDTTKTAS